MNEQKERLERELKFLEESLEAGVITKEEYEKGKQRITNKLEEISPEEEKAEQEKKEEIEIKEEKDEDSFVINKKVLFTIGIIALIIVAYFLIRLPGRGHEAPITAVEKEEPIKPLCISDDDCKKQGKIGICQQPNTAEAACLFKDPIEVDLTIINDKNCISCDTSRMINVLEQLFLTININEIDYNSAEAKKSISELKINTLPAYIFDSRINETVRFKKFKRALSKTGNNYIILPTASGADYFFNRREINNKLDLFTLSNDTQKLDNNMQEVLDLFEDDIDYAKHMGYQEEKAALKDELAITTYPTFLVNNKLKFSGIQPAETIKEKFCELNELKECSVTLSGDIKN